MQLASTALLVLLHWLVESSKYKNDVLSASRCFLFLRKSHPVKWCGAAQQSFQNKKGPASHKFVAPHWSEQAI